MKITKTVVSPFINDETDISIWFARTGDDVHPKEEMNRVARWSGDKKVQDALLPNSWIIWSGLVAMLDAWED